MKKLVHYFATGRHMKMCSTNLFNIRQGPLDSLRDSLAYFNEAAIKVVPPNQEIFIEAVQNGPKVGHFNKSLSKKPKCLFAKVVTRAECCIKGEESNIEKKVRDVKECVPRA